MEFNDILFGIFAALTITFFVVANTKKYSPLRKKEAKRYFDGSIINANETYKERVYTHGLALVKDKKSGEVKFKKQAKMCDSALLYS